MACAICCASKKDEVAIQLFQRLRRRQRRTLVVIDQFEELFTLSPVDVQASFARMLGRLVLEADVRVIVSLRDDFLIHCQAHDALLPAFADVTPLGLLGVSSMRRALVQPALACGYRFEDEALVDEMIRDVSRERGALPLLAFAASRLWEKRDRERGLLTWEAYKEIGGVGGALAQHAEVTLEGIGRKRIPLVRELFRNLVTSQGTRAVRERDELLSVFDGKSDTMGTRADAEDVVNALVDARLLNSYVQAGQSGDNQQLVEIVHESLLFAWPRLVQWHAQEADGAQIRDQLRLAAQLWRERGRSEDLLWSGMTYRDFVVWRERYPGPLSANESAFAHASEQLFLRGRRRRRVATASLMVAVTLISVIMFGLWRQSESSLQRAEAETLRSEAGKLLAMAEREAERYPTAALAYAIKSLELTDTEPARLLALKILQTRACRAYRRGRFASWFRALGDGQHRFQPGRRMDRVGRDGAGGGSQPARPGTPGARRLRDVGRADHQGSLYSRQQGPHRESIRRCPALVDARWRGAVSWTHRARGQLDCPHSTRCVSLSDVDAQSRARPGMASPTRSTVAHRIVRAYRTTRGDRRSSRLRSGTTQFTCDRFATSAQDRNSLPERESLPRASRSRQTRPWLQARTHTRDQVLVGSVEFIGLDCRTRSARRCGRAQLQRLRKVTRRGELRSRLPHVLGLRSHRTGEPGSDLARQGRYEHWRWNGARSGRAMAGHITRNRGRVLAPGRPLGQGVQIESSRENSGLRRRRFTRVDLEPRQQRA